MKQHPEFLQKIDWKLLKEQKLTLLHHLIHNEYDIRKIELFEGLINFIDVIQDYAADEMEISEKEVFNFTEDE